ncbi:MAG: outer membrane protein assembly factor BamE [Aquisalimonadaceae bacterium]
MRHIASIVLLCACCVSLIACSSSSVPFFYQVEIQQGNIITDDMITQLRPGMTKRQVQFVLGKPAIDDIFHENRWDYIHTRADGGGGAPDRLTAIFDDSGSLVDLQGNLAPDNWTS